MSTAQLINHVRHVEEGMIVQELPVKNHSLTVTVQEQASKTLHCVCSILGRCKIKNLQNRYIKAFVMCSSFTNPQQDNVLLS